MKRRNTRMSTIIKHKEFTNHKVYKTEVAGLSLIHI